MKQASLSLLGLLPLAIQVSAQAPPANAQADMNAPLTLLEKNKRETGGSSPPPGLDVRVVGGNQVTSSSKYKYFVEWEDARCGASLIHDDIALSAAHCESLDSPFDTRVFVNGIVSASGVFRTVRQQVSHPLYKVNENNDYDFLILKLDSSALVDENGQATGAETIALNTDPALPVPGAKLMAVGYGLTQEGGTATSEVLNDVEVKYVEDSLCQDQYGTETFAPDLMFCAGVPGGGKDTCQGDSGGPIVDETTGLQMGLVSFGIGCARANYNGMYARLSAATDWIQEQICELSDFPPEGCPSKPQHSGKSGSGEITLDITYDGYASETAISFISDTTGEQLYFQPYFAPNAINGKTETLTFSNLPAGDYSLLIGDDGKDGMCCGYGKGAIVVNDKKNNKKLWQVSTFKQFVQANFKIDTAGQVTYQDQTTDYQNSWELSPEPPNYPQNFDQLWPGPLPDSTRGLNINFKFDRYPEEISWTLNKLDGSSWSEIKSFNGQTDGVFNDLQSTQLTDLAAGWYELDISDSGGDGVCCKFRRGWVAVTGHLLATRKSGLIWGNNGDFGSGVQIYMEMSSTGMVKQISESSPI